MHPSPKYGCIYGTCTGLQHDNIVHRIQRAFTIKMMYRNLGTSGGATNSLNRALIRSHQTDYMQKLEKHHVNWSQTRTPQNKLEDSFISFFLTNPLQLYLHTRFRFYSLNNGDTAAGEEDAEMYITMVANEVRNHEIYCEFSRL